MVKTIDATTTDRLRRSPLYLDLSPSCARIASLHGVNHNTPFPTALKAHLSNFSTLSTHRLVDSLTLKIRLLSLLYFVTDFLEGCHIGIVIGLFGAVNDGHFQLANRGVDYLCALHKTFVATPTEIPRLLKMSFSYYILANYFGYCVYPKSVIRAYGYLQRI